MKSKTTSFGTVARKGHDASAFYKRKMYRGAPPRKTAHHALSADKPNRPSQVNVIHHHDSRDMHHLPDNSVHLMITSPPYNVGKDYDDDLSLRAYKQLLADVLTETHRVLVEGGRACVNIANIGRAPYIPLHTTIVNIAHKIGFFMRGEIIWDKGASAGSSCAWGSWRSASNPVLRDVHEYILVFCKNNFKRHPLKKNTISRDDFITCTKSIWRFNATSAKKIGHPAPFPVELPSRLIQLYAYADDIVLDPFMGAGTTAVAARASGRDYVGYEIDSHYVKLAQKRLSASRGFNSHAKRESSEELLKAKK